MNIYKNTKPTIAGSLNHYSPVVILCTTTCNTGKFYLLPTQCMYVLCMDLRTNSDYFPIDIH